MTRLPWLCLVPVAGCAALPDLRPAAPEESAALEAECRARFPAGEWQTVHAIDARLPDGSRTTFLGATSASDEARRFRSLLISVEGMVALEIAWTAETTEVIRQVPPLDREGVGPGMADDLRLLLLAPAETPAAVGRYDDGAVACRWTRADGGWHDVAVDASGAWRVGRYDDGEALLREVTASAERQSGFPVRARIAAPGMLGYSLSLELVQLDLGPLPAELPASPPEPPADGVSAGAPETAPAAP